jgi:hypothetical protein
VTVTHSTQINNEYVSFSAAHRDDEHDVVDVDHDDVSAVHHLKDSWGDSIEGRYVFVFVSVCVVVRVCVCVAV